MHLEEDAGKSLHDGLPDSSEWTSIDLNRSGVPLIEIVSEPDISSPDEAYEYLTRLKEIILYTGVSDCNMEEGSLRCDANVSIRPRGQTEFGTKTEVKNVNSFRFIRQALEYEIERHEQVIESGGTIEQETRLYNSAEGKTYGMRSKEQAHDYRYFPEPDLLPLVVDEKWRRKIVRSCLSLPEARRARMVRQYGITEYDAATSDQQPRAGRSVRRGRRSRQESQARRQPGAERVDGPPESQRTGDRAVANFDEGRGHVRRPGRERCHQRQDAEGPLRSRLRARRGLSGHLREGKAAADHRHRRPSKRSSTR